MAVIHSLYREPGTVTVDAATCNGCGECADICAAGVLRAVDGRVEVRADGPFGCIGCGHCMMVCPTGSVTVTGRGLSPADLLPLPAPAERAAAAALAALLRGRRSIRRFTEREPEAGLLRQVVEEASAGPMGIPPWDVGCVIVCGRTAVDGLAANIVACYDRFRRVLRPWVLKLLRPVLGRATYEMFAGFVLPLAEEFVRQRRAGRDALFYRAPAVLLFHHSLYADPADATVLCTQAMLAAEAHGLGTTMIGSVGPILAKNRRLCRKWGIPAGHKPALALILGYPAARFRRAIRRHLVAVRLIERNPPPAGAGESAR